MARTNAIEKSRIELQAALDAAKTRAERNRLGQFATPDRLARAIVDYACSLLPPRSRIRFLDPAFGTGAFYSALQSAVPSSRISSAVGFEVDPCCGREARSLWRKTKLELRIADFTAARPPAPGRPKANLLICNPPYVRHHHLSSQDKSRLRLLAERCSGERLHGLSGLYCYFLCISHAWMCEEAIGAWLIPSEFMDVNYGRFVKRYLLNELTVHRIHRFDPSETQFSDALVSSAVLFFRKQKPPAGHQVQFTYGGAIEKPAAVRLVPNDGLDREPKWTKYPHAAASFGKRLVARGKINTLSDFFDIKRGLATGCNDFFLMTSDQARSRGIPKKWLAPILPSPRYLTVDEIPADLKGEPAIDNKLFLLSCSESEKAVRAKHPNLWRYLLSGKQVGVHQRYLCRHRQPWYSQEKRPASLFLCTYLGRPSEKNFGSPFRMILNHSNATAANVYLMLYPKPWLAEELAGKASLIKRVWEALCEIRPQAMLREGRVYGGGLHKLEPKELGNVRADSLLDVLSQNSEAAFLKNTASLTASACPRGNRIDSSASFRALIV